MARRFLTSIDLAYFALLNALIQPTPSDPTGLTSAQTGAAWTNTTTGKFKYWNGSAAIDPTDRSTHTGSQLSTTISDLAATVLAYRLDQFASATNPITIPNGTANGHAVNRGQLDAVAAAAATGTSIKDPVRAATVGDTNTGATGVGAVMDGVTLILGDRVLLKNQATASQNGIYIVGSSALSRASDMDASGEVKPGTIVYVAEGTTNGDKQFAVTSDASINVGTTAMTWGQLTGSGTTYSGTAPINVSGSTISLAYTTGLTNSGGNLTVDGTVARKIAGVIPATTSGIYSVSGSTVTVNHALANSAPRVTVRYYTAPGTGNTQGALVEIDEVASDPNNVVLTFPAAPAANQYAVTITG